MVFSSYVFIFAFLPVTLLGYFLLAKLKNPLFQRLFLVAASLVYYAWFNVSYLWIILTSIGVNYLLAHLMTRGHAKKLLFVLGILFNVGMLGYFKYTDFFLENLNALFSASFTLKHILLPLGISFFTFQQFSYLLAVYQGESQSEGFFDYCLFVLFFPQLVAGPIVLYDEMMPQFLDESRRKVNYENLAAGLYLFVIGLSMKLVLADTAAVMVQNGFSGHAGTLLSGWCTSLAYTMQIFFDFFGYATMAIGLGRMFNIDIPQNFDRPYRAESIGAFWRRWHMTLGRALSAYVYRPLGGNRKGLPRTLLNLMLTFLVSGVWHGAAWTFVLWGALHGLLSVLERLLGDRLLKVPLLLRKIGTFLSVNFLWVLFRADSFTSALSVYRGMFNVSDLGLWDVAELPIDGTVGFPAFVRIAFVFGLLALMLFLSVRMKNAKEQLAAFTGSKKQLIVTVLLFVLCVLHLNRESIFIYWNF